MRLDPRPVLTALAAVVLTTVPVIADSHSGPRPERASPGCEAGGEAAPSSLVASRGETRRVQVHVPSAHDGATPLPMII
jgi:hypothetical protein